MSKNTDRIDEEQVCIDSLVWCLKEIDANYAHRSIFDLQFKPEHEHEPWKVLETFQGYAPTRSVLWNRF